MDNLGDMLGRFRKDKKEGKVELPPDEVARLIRDIQLNLIDYGAIASDQPVPDKPHPKATKLPHLLQYSPVLVRHLQTLRGILATPREFIILGDDENGEDDQEGDILYRKEGSNHVFYFGDSIVEPFSNPWRSAASSEYVAMNTSISETNSVRAGMWQVNYFYSEATLSPNNVGSTNYLPERIMALQFWFSPKRLSSDEIFEYFSKSEYLASYLTVVDTKTDGGFTQTIIHHDAQAQADEEELGQPSDFRDSAIAFLRQKGSTDFAIVELGTVMIGGKMHWIYTGAEQAKISVKDEKRVGQGSLQQVTVGR